MDFAADAVVEVLAQPARPSPSRAPAHEAGDEPSFDDHVRAATQEAGPTESAPATDQASTPSDRADAVEALLGGPDPQPAAVTPAPTAEQTAAPVLVQLIAAVAPQQQQIEAQSTGAPTQPANAAPAPITAPEAPAQTPAIAAPVAGKARHTSDAAPTENAPAPAKAAPAGEKNLAPTASTSPATPAAAAPAAQTVTPAPTAPATTAPANSAAAPAIAGAAVAAQPASDAATRQPKAAHARGDAKSEAPAAAEQSSAPTPTAAPRLNAKSATPQSAGKDAIAFQPIDAPEAPQQQSMQSAPQAATPTSPTHHAEAEQNTARALPATQQVAREIVRRFEGGNTRFELRLDPPELGRVEVRLDVSRDHRVTAVIAADSPQALTELARHARELEQMLQGAGLELSDSGLSFDLRQNAEHADAAEFGSRAGFEGAAPAEEQTQIAARPLGYERWRGVRVDMMV